MLKLVVVSLLIFYNINISAAATDKVFCYYMSWTDYYSPDNVDVNACTHIFYAFIGINDDGTLRIDDDWNNILVKLPTLKQKNPNLKVLFSVGGWNEGGAKFSEVAADSGKKDTLVADAIRLCQQYNFDGLDVDWEFPADPSRGGNAADKENFIDMLRRLKAGFQQYGYILTAALNNQLLDGYDIPQLSQVLDYINLMTYDFHSGSEAQTAENTPLYPRSADSDWSKQHLNVQASLQMWLGSGADPNKLVLGLAFYGIQFTLVDPNQHGMGAPTTSTGTQVIYATICNNGYEEAWDDEQKVPYRFSGTNWIGFDNAQSIQQKVQFAKDNGLAGVMMWAVNQDSIDGSCTSLLETIKNNL